MANLLDSSGSQENQGNSLLSAPEFKDWSCGGATDWMREVESFRQKVGLPRRIRESALTTVIEREIIPRLFLTHCGPAVAARRETAMRGRNVDLDGETLTKLVLSAEPIERIMDQLQSMLDGGMSLKRIYLDILAPIARRLGEYWAEDRCTFIEMTLALSRLHWLLREVGRRNGEGLQNPPVKRRIFLAAAPNEQHTFGMVMIEEFFLHSGWEMASDHTASASAIVESLNSHNVEVVGFSISCEEFLGPLQDVIDIAMKASFNRQLSIMVGGSLFREHPDFALRIRGATVVPEGVNAVETAEQLVSPSPRTGYVEQPT